MHSVPALNEEKKTRDNETNLTICSKSMGPDAHICGMQPWCRRLFLSLLFPLPRVIAETPQIRHSVSSSLMPRGSPYPPTYQTLEC